MATSLGAAQGSLIEYAGVLPQCGLDCILEQLPQSACKVATNDTCICSDDGLRESMQTCLLQRCDTVDAIDVAKIEAKACGRPIRTRKADIMAPLILQIAGILAVLLRLYARWTMMPRLEADDWIMIVCGVIFIVLVVIGQIAGALAFGEDIWMVEPDKLTLGLKLFFIDEPLYLATITLTKISVLIFYLRIFPNKSFRRATYATITYIVTSMTVILFLQIFQCTPISFNWDGWKRDFGTYRCLDLHRLVNIAGGLSISHDLIILVLPLPLLWGLNTSKRSKIGISLMFSLGLFILITACIRLHYLAPFTHSLNPTWDFTDPLIWSGIEASVSVIVVCLPAIRIFFKYRWSKLFGQNGTARGGVAPRRGLGAVRRKAQDTESADSKENAITAIDEGAAGEMYATELASVVSTEEKNDFVFSFQSTRMEADESGLELELEEVVPGEEPVRYPDGAYAKERN
ncbi:CFEM domain-containing protein [Colletotrichum chrysophilum]|uniref:CFEM domain-containing protein n=1 Tax=Colletotrichum chrysophilum TaxID=1836956 RepID=A0AAD9EHV5_9PEZI|nr:CFEM domain-containing protein [Colletotrichum chrysophilum]